MCAKPFVSTAIDEPQPTEPIPSTIWIVQLFGFPFAYFSES